MQLFDMAQGDGLRELNVVSCLCRRSDSAATVSGGEQELTVANGCENHQQCLQQFRQSLQRNQAWSGRRGSYPRCQLGKLEVKMPTVRVRPVLELELRGIQEDFSSIGIPWAHCR